MATNPYITHIRAVTHTGNGGNGRQRIRVTSTFSDPPRGIAWEVRAMYRCDQFAATVADWLCDEPYSPAARHAAEILWTRGHGWWLGMQEYNLVAEEARAQREYPGTRTSPEYQAALAFARAIVARAWDRVKPTRSHALGPWNGGRSAKATARRAARRRGNTIV